MIFPGVPLFETTYFGGCLEILSIWLCLKPYSPKSSGSSSSSHENCNIWEGYTPFPDQPSCKCFYNHFGIQNFIHCQLVLLKIAAVLRYLLARVETSKHVLPRVEARGAQQLVKHLALGDRPLLPRWYTKL